MKNIVYLVKNLDSINEKYIDSYLLAVKDFSTRSMFGFSLEEIISFKENVNKEIYLLCDVIITQDKISLLREYIDQIFEIADLVFFQDFAFFMEAKKRNKIDKLVFYSPTLLVSEQDLSIYKELGIKYFILSKECTYSDYKSILNNHNDIKLGMLSLGYPQIYYSKRKMLSSFKDQYNLDYSFSNLKIREKTRDIYQPIYEDENGTYIFAGEIFFPQTVLKEFLSLGMEMFLIDGTFINEDNLSTYVYEALNGKQDFDFGSSFVLFLDMVNDYGK